MADISQANNGPLPQFELLTQCRTILRSVDINQWDTLNNEQKHAIGMIGRWSIEKALQAFLIAMGRPIPATQSLQDLYRTIGEQILPPLHEHHLGEIDRRVLGSDVDDWDIEEEYKNAYWLAQGIIGIVTQNIVFREHVR